MLKLYTFERVKAELQSLGISEYQIQEWAYLGQIKEPEWININTFCQPYRGNYVCYCFECKKLSFMYCGSGSVCIGTCKRCGSTHYFPNKKEAKQNYSTLCHRDYTHIVNEKDSYQRLPPGDFSEKQTTSKIKKIKLGLMIGNQYYDFGFISDIPGLKMNFGWEILNKDILKGIDLEK